MQTDLVVRAQRGDREAFEILAAWATPRLMTVARGVLREIDAAEDAVQRALLGMWRGLPSLRDPERFDAWSYRLVVHSCHAELRGRDPLRSSAGTRSQVEPSVGDQAERLVERDRLEQAMAKLSPRHRSVLMLHVVLDHTQEETARILGVPIGTVHSRVARAMDALRGSLAVDDGRLAALLDPAPVADAPPLLADTPECPMLADPIGLERFAGRRIVVSTDGFGDATTIAGGLSQARDGDVLLVQPGIYRESVTVTRQVAIVGDGPAGSVQVAFHDRPERQTIHIGWAGGDAVRVSYGFHLVRTRALLVNLAISGPREAVAVIVDGGAPELQNLGVVLDGLWAHTIGHLFVVLRGAARGSITGCTASANVLVTEGSAPTIEHNRLAGALTVRDPGSAPTIVDNDMMVRGKAPWCLGIIRGASPVVEGNRLTWTGGSAIAVFSQESRPAIRGNVISGSRIGIQTWDQSAPSIEDNDIRGNTVGVSVCWANPDLQANAVTANQATGLLVLGGPSPRLDGNRMHRNGSGHVRPVGMREMGPRALRRALERM